MAVYLLIFNNKGNITEVFFVEYWNEVFLQVVIVTCSHHVIGVSVVLSTSCTFFSYGSKTANILQAVIWLILLIRGIERIVTWRIEIMNAVRILTLSMDPLLISLTWLSNYFFLVISWLNISQTTLIFNLKIIISVTWSLSYRNIQNIVWIYLLFN